MSKIELTKRLIATLPKHKNKDFNLVTIKDKQCYIQKYVVSLKDRKNVSIILRYYRYIFQKYRAVKSFIFLQKTLLPLDILTQYTVIILITLILDIRLLRKIQKTPK